MPHCKKFRYLLCRIWLFWYVFYGQLDAFYLTKTHTSQNLMKKKWPYLYFNTILSKKSLLLRPVVPDPRSTSLLSSLPRCMLNSGLHWAASFSYSVWCLSYSLWDSPKHSSQTSSAVCLLPLGFNYLRKSNLTSFQVRNVSQTDYFIMIKLESR